MYGIFTYIDHKNQQNVGKYTIHGSYWKGKRVFATGCGGPEINQAPTQPLVFCHGFFDLWGDYYTLPRLCAMSLEQILANTI